MQIDVRRLKITYCDSEGLPIAYLFHKKILRRSLDVSFLLCFKYTHASVFFYVLSIICELNTVSHTNTPVHTRAGSSRPCRPKKGLDNSTKSNMQL